MDRIIGQWHNENDTTDEIAELILQSNSIQFYRRGVGDPLCNTFIGGDSGDSNHFVVYTDGTIPIYENRTLEGAEAYNVKYIIQTTSDEPFDERKTKIRAVKFEFPELPEWIHKKLIECSLQKDGRMIAEDKVLPNITLKEDHPKISIVFESFSYENSCFTDSFTSVMLSQHPQILIQYEDDTNLETVVNEISTIIQFFCVMIENITGIDDIYLFYGDEKKPDKIYFNKDFSYNTKDCTPTYQHPTTFEDVSESLTKYFSNWYSFCQKSDFDFLRMMYFLENGNSKRYVEDIFVVYVKFLEGYFWRTSGEEEKAAQLGAAVKKSQKEIKKLIFTNEEGKSVFEKVIEEAGIGWPYDANHANKISEWIAKGFLGRISLNEILYELDSQCSEILRHNAKYILRTFDNPDQPSDESTRAFIKAIVVTRNYYSHFKASSDGILTASQIYETNHCLKAMIINIFCQNMGIDEKLIRNILGRDRELCMQTHFLIEPSPQQ